MPGRRIVHSIQAIILLAALGAKADAQSTSEADKLPDGALGRIGTLRWRHGDPITFVAAPPDGKTLLTAGQDSVVRLWDRATGAEIRRFVPPQGSKNEVRFNTYMQGLTRAAMSKDGKLLAVASQSSQIQLWDVDTGKALRQVKSPLNGVASMVFSPDGKMLVVRGVQDRIAYQYDCDSGKEIRQLKPVPPGGKQGNIFGGAGDGTAVAISSDGKTVALSELEFDGMRVSGSVTLFDLASGKEIRRIASQMNGISSLAFSPNNKTLVFNTHSSIHLHDADSGKELRQIRIINGVQLMFFAGDDKTIAVKGRDQLVRMYDVANGNLVRTVGEKPGAKGVNAAFFTNPNGAIITDVALADAKTLIMGGQQMPRFFDLTTGAEQILAGGGHRGAVTALLTSVDGKSILSRGAEGTLRVWDVGAKEIRQFAEPAGTSAVCFSADGKLVALGNNDGTVHLVDVATGKEKRRFKAHLGTIASIVFSADGKRLATRGSYDGLIHVFDADKGVELKKISYHDVKAGNGTIIRTPYGQRDGNPLAFSPDGKTVATYIAPQQIYVQGRPQVQPDSNCLRFFDVATGKETRRIAMAEGRTINQIVYSLDGRLLVSENIDKTISLWEIASGQERRRLGEPVATTTTNVYTSFVINGVARSGPALAPMGVTLAMSRDGNLIAGPGANNTVKVFDASLGKEVATFRGHDGAIASLEFSANGKTLVSGSNDTTVLLWDLTRVKREPRPQITTLPEKEFDQMWADLISSDAKKAGQTIEMLVAASELSVTLLKDRVQPVPPVDQQKLDKWIRDLDSTQFKNRALAAAELEKLGELAIPALQQALKANASIEMRRRLEPMLEELTAARLTPQQVRAVRAIEVLDRIGTSQARHLLERLASGAAGSLTTREAQAALGRPLSSKN